MINYYGKKIAPPQKALALTLPTPFSDGKKNWFNSIYCIISLCDFQNFKIQFTLE